MQEQLNDVEAIIRHTDIIFEEMKEQMNEVSKIAVKLSDISFKTTLLSLNASVEAVHAGSAGKGFAVVATEMKQLSENSEVFAEQVTVAVNSLLNKVELSAEQFQGSAQAILDSQKTMDELQTSFNSLTDRFNVIYSTIEEQNSNIVQVDDIFSNLTANINDMRQSSESNQNAITEIVKSIENYRVSVKEIVDRTRRI